MQKANEMKRICIVIPSLSFGLRYWQYIVNACALSDIRVDLLTAIFQGGLLELPVQTVRGRILAYGRQVHGYRRTFALVSPRLFTVLLGLRPDAILAIEYSMTTAYAVCAGKLLGVPVLIFQEHSSRERFSLGPFRRMFRRLLARWADGVIANTEGARRELIGQLGVKEEKVTSIPLLVPPNRRDLIQVPISLPELAQRPLFLYVGQLTLGKNVHSILHAARILSIRGLAFSIWIAGDGPLRWELQNAAVQLHISNWVTFLGQIPYESVGFAYQEADVFVMPTFSDYRSMSVLEAMRFGKPIIDSIADGCVDDCVTDGLNGWVFDPNRPDQLADCMSHFIGDEQLVIEMGKRSENVIARHTPEAAANTLIELLRHEADE